MLRGIEKGRKEEGKAIVRERREEKEGKKINNEVM